MVKYQKGFKFKPTFESNIAFFEVRGIDETKDEVLTIVHPKQGNSFESSIEKRYYDSAFEIGEYIAVGEEIYY